MASGKGDGIVVKHTWTLFCCKAGGKEDLFLDSSFTFFGLSQSVLALCATVVCRANWEVQGSDFGFISSSVEDFTCRKTQNAHMGHVLQ